MKNCLQSRDDLNSLQHYTSKPYYKLTWEAITMVTGEITKVIRFATGQSYGEEKFLKIDKTEKLLRFLHFHEIGF